MIVRAIQTRIFREGDDLLSFINDYVATLKDGSILAITSKVVSLWERRTVVKTDDSDQKEKLIKKESDVSIQTEIVWLSVRDGMFMTSGGIDESNGNGKFVLLPRDSYASAQKIHRALKKKFKNKRFGVLITDSRCLPLRAGAVGMALGYAGFKGIRDYRGSPDLFGRILSLSRSDVADGLASAAVLVMGEGREKTPLVVIEDAPVIFSDRQDKKELLIPIEEDMYRPLFARFFRSRGKSSKTDQTTSHRKDKN